MASVPQQRFKTSQDWNNFISTRPPLSGQDLFEFRKTCYLDIEKLRGNPLIVYASKFIDGSPQGSPISIELNDVDGFTDLVNHIDGSETIDVLIHSPGGSPVATERLVTIIRSKFSRVNFLIPHSAYSAATMLALSGDNIILHPNATLGPWKFTTRRTSPPSLTFGGFRYIQVRPWAMRVRESLPRPAFPRARYS